MMPHVHLVAHVSPDTDGVLEVEVPFTYADLCDLISQMTSAEKAILRSVLGCRS